MLDVSTGGGEQDEQDRAALWDARIEMQIGAVIRRILTGDPPPAGSQVGADLWEWGRRLENDGRRGLLALGHPAVRAVA
jgi:hypothetical protein